MNDQEAIEQIRLGTSALFSDTRADEPEQCAATTMMILRRLGWRAPYDPVTREETEDNDYIEPEYVEPDWIALLQRAAIETKTVKHLSFHHLHVMARAVGAAANARLALAERDVITLIAAIDRYRCHQDVTGSVHLTMLADALFSIPVRHYDEVRHALAAPAPGRQP